MQYRPLVHAVYETGGEIMERSRGEVEEEGEEAGMIYWRCLPLFRIRGERLRE